jgi:hypothetical protein
MRQSALQQALEESVTEVASGTSMAVHVPFFSRTWAVADGPELASSPPTAMHEDDVVQAALVSGISMLNEGVPVT